MTERLLDDLSRALALHRRRALETLRAATAQDTAPSAHPELNAA